MCTELLRNSFKRKILVTFERDSVSAEAAKVNTLDV